MNIKDLSGQHVLLVGFGVRQRAELRDCLQGIGVQMFAALGKACNLRIFMGLRTSFNCALVNIDAFDSIKEGIDELLHIRDMSDHMVIVLCSTQFERDDLSTERAAICDAALRLPATDMRLKMVLSAAFNNRVAQRLQHRVESGKPHCGIF